MAPLKLKLVALIIGVFIGVAPSCDAAPTKLASTSFLQKTGNRKAATTTSPIAGCVFSIPRGGNSYANLAKKAYYTLTGVHGAVSALAPTETGRILYNDKFHIEEDSLAELCMEYVGTCLIGCLYMAMLAFDTDMDAATITAHGTYPCALMNLRNLLKGKFAKHGWHNGAGIGMTLATLLLPLAIRSGKYDSELIARINILVPLFVGATGFFDRSLGMKVSGHKDGVSEYDGITQALSGWFCSAMFMWAIIAGLLLAGFEPEKAVGFSALFFFIDLVNNNHVRKSNEALALDALPGHVMALILGGISYCLLRTRGE